ncbi:MAG: hypothetical protein K1X61_03155 [Chitinophagales bacterium]|nr:hypothetical protein [Chitinophagales bacterium]
MPHKKAIAILVILFLLPGFLRHATAQYCIPAYTNSCNTGAYINKFTFNTLINSGSGCNGNPENYILYPAIGNTTTAVVLGGSFSLSVKSNNADGIGIWIDYNNDEDFDDAGEFVYTSPFYSNTLFTGTIIIPNNTAFIGERRLRVRGVLQTLLYENHACETFTSGETEDYIITINPAPPCTGTPVAGNLTAFPSSICAEGNTSELNLSGYSVASGIGITWDSSADGAAWNTISGATNSNYTTAPLFTSAYYRAKVACIESGQFSYSNEIKINVGEVKILSVTNDSLCGPGTAELQVLSNATTVAWFATATSVSPLFSSTFPFKFSPAVTGTSTFYASGASGTTYIDSVGMKDNLTGSGSDAYESDYLVFNTLHACKLTGVHVYPSEEGLVIIQLRDKNFIPLKTDTFQVIASQVNQKVYIELNFNLEPGNGFQLTLLDGSVPLWSNQSGVNFPYDIPNVLSLYTSNLGPNYYFYFYDWLLNYTNQCETPRVPVTAVVSVPPPLSVVTTPANASICGNSGQQVEINASQGFLYYAWSPSTGLSVTTGMQVNATPLVTTTYTVWASDSICQNETTVTVVVANTPSVSVISSADSICAGTSAQLFATATPLLNYAVDEITFSPETGAGDTVLLQEDELSSPLPIGFTFKFFGNYYDHFEIGSNGFITFDPAAADGCCAGQKLPEIISPNNLIAFAWEDLSPQLGGSVSYFTTGTAPHRKLVVRFDGVPHFSNSGSSDPVTAQVQLYEGSNLIEIHTTSMPGNPSGFWLNHTMGIENANGTLAAVVPGRNANATWTAAADAWRFSPNEYAYSWLPAGTLNNPNVSDPIATPAGTTIYTVTVLDTATQCAGTAAVQLKLINKPVPGEISPAFNAFCEEGSDTLQLEGYTSGATIQWLQSFNSGGPYTATGVTGAEYAISLLDTSSYFIAEVSCSSTSYTEEAALQVLPVPPPPSGDSVHRCGAGKVVLVAQGSGGSICWYDAAAGGNYLGQGESFTTPSIAQPTIFWAEEGPPPAAPLPTTFIGGNITDGNMFSITAIENIMITGFDGHMSTGQSADIELYYKKGSYAGYENDPSAWHFSGVANAVAGMGVGIPTPYPLPLNLMIPAGNTYSFYITSKTNNINYTLGTLEGSVFAADDMLEVKEGIAITYPFGAEVHPVKWNGIIHYQQVGCASERTPVNAIVYLPQIIAAADNNSICLGDTIMLTAQNTGWGNYSYQWQPVLPSMVPADGTGDVVTIAPLTSVTFTLTATAVNTVCDTLLSVPVAVHLPPSVTFAGLPDTVFLNDAPLLLTGNPAGGTFSGIGVSGNMFDPAAAGAGGPYTVSYSYTDSYGCTGDTSQSTIVLINTGTGDCNDVYLFSVAPNPSAGVFMMDVYLPTAAGEIRIIIQDMYGRLVYDKQSDLSDGRLQQAFDFSYAPKGNYLVELKAGDIMLHRKITLQ